MTNVAIAADSKEVLRRQDEEEARKSRWEICKLNEYNSYILYDLVILALDMSDWRLK